MANFMRSLRTLCYGALFASFTALVSRHHFKQVAHHSVIRHLKDRRVAVFMDGDYSLRSFHPDEMGRQLRSRRLANRGSGSGRSGAEHDYSCAMFLVQDERLLTRMRLAH